MKFLRKFNESKEDLNSFYFKIESSEYWTMIEESEKFIDKEINIINNCFAKYDIKSPFRYPESKSFKIKGDEWIDVTKTRDEWFIIHITPIKLGEIQVNPCSISALNIYYKCDQIDGLIKFLDNWIPDNFF